MPSLSALFLARLRLMTLSCLAGLLLTGTAAHAAGELERAQALWLQGQRAQAMQLLRSAMASDADDARLRFALATMQMEQGQLSEAEQAFVSLNQDHPDLADPFNNLAVIRAARGDLDAAREALEQALRLQPEHAAALENLGDVLLRLAARHYERAAQLASGDKQPLLLKLEKTRALLPR